jgi:hypothetical protein
MKRSRLLITVTFLLLALTANGQKVNKGNVISIHKIEYTLEEGMTFEQFEKLYQEEYIPSLEKNFPGVEFHLLKGERGKRTGKYIEFVVFDSLEERNRWWPEKGKSSEAAKQAFDNMREIQDRMMKMVSSHTFTDYVVL